jgi:hypothetical protein
MPYEKFAWTCIWLSLQADDPKLRDMLMRLARIWIRATLKKPTIRKARRVKRLLS